MVRKILIVWAVLARLAVAQLDATAEPAFMLDGLGSITQIGQVSFVDEIPKLKTKPVGLIRVETEAENVELSVSDKSRTPYDPVEIAPGIYLIEKPGKWWVEITAIDFGKQIYGRKSLLVEIGEAPPEPDDEDDDDGPPPGPSPPIDNSYGVGKVAFDAAPDDIQSARQYAQIYKRAGDFLFGIPSLKFVISNSGRDSQNPDRSIMAWIGQEYDKIVCTDEQTCKQWAKWKQAIKQALLDAQSRRQFTRDDWFAAFNEISKAVGTPKQ